MRPDLLMDLIRIQKHGMKRVYRRLHEIERTVAEMRVEAKRAIALLEELESEV